MVTVINDYPMSIPAYVITAMAPSFLFMLLSIPVKRKNLLQEVTLTLLWLTELSIPIYYAGKFPYLCLISTSVWAWASSMKMGVWVFSMGIEERRQRPFVFTLTDWRKRGTTPAPITLETLVRPDSDYFHVPLGSLLRTTLKHQLAFDTIDFIFNYGDVQRPIQVFSAFLSVIYEFLGQNEKAASLVTAEPLSYTCILISILMCMLFCVYLQMQLQVTYDMVMVAYALIYKCLPALERWQLGEDSKKLKTKNIANAKAVLRRIHGIRAIKAYIEGTLTMPPLFDSPWSARSLRDFWGRRWHTIYNDCFYRLGYRPIRWAVILIFGCKPPRWLPALSVFVMSGIMHEYFLYAATGSTLYFGSPLPACGFQFMFFVIQVGFIIIGDNFFRNGPLGRIYTVFCMAITSHLFVVPYVLTGYIYMERFSFYRLATGLYEGSQNFLAHNVS